MNPRMGRNVILVRLLANANKKDVAADTGVEKLSYSSKGGRNNRVFCDCFVDDKIKARKRDHRGYQEEVGNKKKYERDKKR
jgi:hypothetical protein